MSYEQVCTNEHNTENGHDELAGAGGCFMLPAAPLGTRPQPVGARRRKIT